MVRWFTRAFRVPIKLADHVPYGLLCSGRSGVSHTSEEIKLRYVTELREDSDELPADLCVRQVSSNTVDSPARVETQDAGQVAEPLSNQGQDDNNDMASEGCPNGD
jgi:hypothetical protein